MKHGKHEIPRSKKGITVLVALALIFCCSIGGTLAWLATSTDPVTNTFLPGSVPIEVNEDFNGTTKSNVTVKNTGNVDAYIRAAIIINWADEHGNVYGVAPTSSDYTLSIGSSWTQSGGYYYYNSRVAADASTGNLINSIAPVADKAPDGFNLQVTILAESIQADGLGATTAQAAWDAAKK